MGPKIASKDLEEYCNRLICSWRNKYGEKLYEQCSQLTGALINDLKPIFKGRLYGEDKVAGHDYNFIYLFLILAKALEDIILLVTLTKDKNWHDDHTKAENIWQVLWDAKERLDVFGSHCLDKDLFDDLYGQLKELEIFFYDCFGKGLYMSPVMLIKKADCNICGKNLKACDHIPGNLYRFRVSNRRYRGVPA